LSLCLWGWGGVSSLSQLLLDERHPGWVASPSQDPSTCSVTKLYSSSSICMSHMEHLPVYMLQSLVWLLPPPFFFFNPYPSTQTFFPFRPKSVPLLSPKNPLAPEPVLPDLATETSNSMHEDASDRVIKAARRADRGPSCLNRSHVCTEWAWFETFRVELQTCLAPIGSLCTVIHFSCSDVRRC